MVVDSGSDPEMEMVEQILRDAVSGIQIARFKSLADANRSARKQIWFPQIIVVCQSWTQQYQRADVEALIANWPLARIMNCYGPWCDSDGRNSDVWPHGTRIPICHFRNRLRIELQVLSGSTTPLPLTAARDEAFEYNYQREAAQGEGIRVHIQMSDSDYAGSLAALLTANGFRTEPSHVQAQVVLWDGDTELVPVRGQKNVALCGLISMDEIRRLKRIGATQVLSKLASGADLTEAILLAAGRSPATVS